VAHHRAVSTGNSLGTSQSGGIRVATIETDLMALGLADI
jgi:hypothetical protein